MKPSAKRTESELDIAVEIKPRRAAARPWRAAVSKRFARFRRLVLLWSREIVAVHSSPHEIALGFAIGAFISILPTPGFNFLLGAAAITVYPRMNKAAVFAAIALINPITMIPLYWASYALGSVFFGPEPVVRYDVVILDQAYNFTRRYLIGNAIVATTASALSYFAVRRAAVALKLRAKTRATTTRS